MINGLFVGCPGAGGNPSGMDKNGKVGKWLKNDVLSMVRRSFS